MIPALTTDEAATCLICGEPHARDLLIPGSLVRDPIATEIRRERPDWTPEQVICGMCLRRYRANHVARLLESESGELSNLQREVIDTLREGEMIAEDINRTYDVELTFGQRTADRVANFGGSWRFLSLFAAFIVFWISANVASFLWHPFDIYPFILLNLMLSCLAAVQAPVILMSQNRQEARDRLRAEHDYQVNLKAEIEVRQLNMKMDELLLHQWQRLLEIQQVQVELMEELSEARRRRAEA